jgi:hypothetical protein
MRALMLATPIVLAGILSIPAHAADVPPPPYGAAPPPAYGAAPPPPPYGPPPAYAYPAPQAYGYSPPPVYRRPPGVVAAPEGPAYVVPGPAYQAGGEYEEQPVAVDARRYYRDCWWEWGFRRCALRSKYWFW